MYKEANTEKAFYQSKTLWFAVLTFVIAIANIYGFGDFSLPPDIAKWYALASPLVFALLRAVTDKRITMK